MVEPDEAVDAWLVIVNVPPEAVLGYEPVQLHALPVPQGNVPDPAGHSAGAGGLAHVEDSVVHEPLVHVPLVVLQVTVRLWEMVPVCGDGQAVD